MSHLLSPHFTIVLVLTPCLSSTSQNPDDVVITLAIRTPLAKAGKGGFKDTSLDALLYKIMVEVLNKSKIDPQVVEDICVGNVRPSHLPHLLCSLSQSLLILAQVNDPRAAYFVRAASLAAGFPNTTAASSVNRFCSSGLKAVQDIANQIHLGSIDVGLAIGAELMSAGGSGLPLEFCDELLQSQSEAKDCLQPMGQTSENVGSDFNVTRESQDRFAAGSYQKAERAQKEGWVNDEIVPIRTKVKDPKTGQTHEVTLTRDEGVRPGTTYESLAKVRPAFKQWGERSTGGNSSQVTDGGMSSPSSIFRVMGMLMSFSSRCNPPHEALPRPRARSTNPSQVRCSNRHWSCATHNGHWPVSRHPQAPHQTEHHP
jgi:acetyl-CoA acyltransferase 1